MKRLLTILLALTIIITAMPLAIADEKVRTSGEFEYTLKGNGTATIVGYHGDSDEDIIIPNMLDGYVVTTIGEKAFEVNRFYSRSATLPESITVIEEKAFWDSGVTSINIPNSVTHIGYGAFACNDSPVIFRISPNHPNYAVIDGALYNKGTKELLYYPSYIENSVRKPYHYSDISIPEGIVSIGDYACYSAHSTKITISFPSTLKSIGQYSFSGRYGNSVAVTNGPIFLDSIGDYAFSETSLDIEKIGATVIGNSAFENSTLFGNLLMEGIEKIGDYAFKTKSSRYLTIPASVKEVGAYSFQANDGYIHFAENTQLTTIGEGAFSTVPDKSRSFDSNRLSVYLPEASQIHSIGAHAFEDSYVYNIESTLNSAETIGEYAFYLAVFKVEIDPWTSNLFSDKATISSACKIIPAHAFDARGPEDSFILQDGVEAIESQAFGKVKDFYLPESLTDIAIDAFYKDSTFVVELGSYAERWAEENAYPYSINGQEQNLDWLLN